MPLSLLASRPPNQDSESAEDHLEAPGADWGQEVWAQPVSALQIVPAQAEPGYAIPHSDGCKVRELGAWLTELNLPEYYAAATRWCVDMGAASLEELAENAEDFADGVSLKPIERQRLRKWAVTQVPEGCSWASPIQLPMGLEAPSRRPQVVAASAAGLSVTSYGHDHGRPQRPQARAVEVVEADDWQADEGGAGGVGGDATVIYTTRSVRLAMDSTGNTGLDLRWDAEWGIAVLFVDPLPGQAGLQAGDFIVAVEGQSLRRRTHSECDGLFAQRLTNGAVLSVVTPTAAPVGSRGGGRGVYVGKGGRGEARPRHGGYDASRMWKNFRGRGPAW